MHVRIEHYHRYKKQYHIIFSDFAYRGRLEAIGLTPSKSRTLGALQVPDLYFRDFLRGEFDGDGCWSMDKRLKAGRLLAILTSGSRIYLDWLRTSIERLAGISKGYISGIDLRYQGEPAKQLGQFLYYAPEVPSLARKRNKWQLWMASPVTQARVLVWKQS